MPWVSSEYEDVTQCHRTRHNQIVCVHISVKYEHISVKYEHKYFFLPLSIQVEPVKAC